MDVFSSSAASENVDFDYKINHLRDQHYQTVTDAEKAVRNDIGAMNEDTTQNIDLLANEHEKHIAEAKEAVMKIGLMQEEYRKMQSNNPLAANGIASQAPQGKSTLDEDDFSFEKNLVITTANNEITEDLNDPTNSTSVQHTR